MAWIMDYIYLYDCGFWPVHVWGEGGGSFWELALGTKQKPSWLLHGCVSWIFTLTIWSQDISTINSILDPYSIIAARAGIQIVVNTLQTLQGMTGKSQPPDNRQTYPPPPPSDLSYASIIAML